MKLHLNGKPGGYTLVELLIAAFGLAVIAVLIGLIVVIVHFVLKFW